MQNSSNASSFHREPALPPPFPVQITLKAAAKAPKPGQSPDSANPLSAEFLATVSHGPGVYQMFSRREILYVGKARDLRKRLSQYAHFSGPPHAKTAVMLSHVERVETILTTTEKEALILEASLIKKHRPRYNVILRDDKNYPFLKVSLAETWPRLSVTRTRLKDGNRYFGPYTSSGEMHATLQLLSDQFPLRHCRTLNVRKRPCLNYQMGRCPAPCAGLADLDEYRKRVEEVLAILEGKTGALKQELEAGMLAASEALDFEQAALYRDRLQALTSITERQVVSLSGELDQDVFGLHRQDASVAVALLFVRGGLVTGAQQFFLADPIGDDAAVLAQVLSQYYTIQRQPPRELLLPLAPEDETLLAEYLAELREGPVTLSVAQRGSRMQLMRMAQANAEKLFSEESRKEESWQALATSLRHRLRLSRFPEVVECLDISNLLGKQAVGSLVCFVHGEKETGRFRHYRIRTKDSPDDYAMMREVLERRLSKGKEEGDLPDLLLLDGGKGQLAVALDVAGRLGILGNMDLAGIAKERHGEGEKLFRPGRKDAILLPAHAPALLYLMRVRDEAHRFGITLHRRLRGKDQLTSALDAVPGIGPRRKRQLLAHFGSLRRIRESSAKELQALPGIGVDLAAAIVRTLQEGEGG